MNIHPPLSSFPFVLLTVTILFEIATLLQNSGKIKAEIRLIVCARYLLCAATIGTVITFLSGYWGEDFANQTFTVAEDLIKTHHNYGRLLLFCMVGCLAAKFAADFAKYHITLFRSVYWFLLVFCFSLSVYTGYLGGELVFEHGAGVAVQSINK